MILMPDDLPDDPVLLKQMLLAERRAQQSQIIDLKEQIKLLRDRLFGRKSEQTVDPETPQLALFNEAESVAASIVESIKRCYAKTSYLRAMLGGSAGLTNLIHLDHPKLAQTVGQDDLEQRLALIRDQHLQVNCAPAVGGNCRSMMRQRHRIFEKGGMPSITTMLALYGAQLHF